MTTNYLRIALLACCALGFLACGGSGGSSSEGLVLEGTLIQGEDASHARLSPKHSGGQPIATVVVCALGACSETDELGHWGFLIEDGFSGTEIEFTFAGHGIDTQTIVPLVGNARDVFLEFSNIAGPDHLDAATDDGVEQPVSVEGHHHDE